MSGLTLVYALMTVWALALVAGVWIVGRALGPLAWRRLKTERQAFQAARGTQGKNCLRQKSGTLQAAGGSHV